MPKACKCCHGMDKSVGQGETGEQVQSGQRFRVFGHGVGWAVGPRRQKNASNLWKLPHTHLTL